MNSLDQQIIKQLIQGLDNGTVNLDNVPALRQLIKDAAAQQMAQLYDTTDFHAKQEAALTDEQAWYHQQINQIVADTASQLNTEKIEQDVKTDITNQQRKLSKQIFALTHMQAELEKQQKFWIPVLLTVIPTLAFLLISFCAIWFMFIR